MHLALLSPAMAAWQTPGVPTHTLAAQQAQPPVGLVATVNDPYFKISSTDVANAVTEQLQKQGVEKKPQASMNAGTPAVIYSANRPLQLAIHGLQIDPQTKRWQAQAYMLSNGQTESVKPVSGFYDAMVDVPVLNRQLQSRDVIAESDLSLRAMPERQLRKDTLTDKASLIGKSPRSIISANRAIRMNELTQPVVVKKGDGVEMHYSSQYMHIKTTGIALEDGAKGEFIRVKNEKSGKAVSAQVEDTGKVEVNHTAASI
jgi:flagella basal body P-ring formation protein FlgA